MTNRRKAKSQADWELGFNDGKEVGVNNSIYRMEDAIKELKSGIDLTNIKEHEAVTDEVMNDEEKRIMEGKCFAERVSLQFAINILRNKIDELRSIQKT